jgi:membrane protein YdbS with pleckstrin-like domain
VTPSRSAPDERRVRLRPRESVTAAASSALLVGRIEAWGGGAALATIALAIALVVPRPWTVVCCAVASNAVVSALVESVFFVPIAIRNFRVEIVSTGILVYRGALFRSVDHVPSAKITVVRRQDGPLLRRLGVAKCVLFTPAREIVLLPMATGDVDRMMELGVDA